MADTLSLPGWFEWELAVGVSEALDSWWCVGSFAPELCADVYVCERCGLRLAATTPSRCRTCAPITSREPLVDRFTTELRYGLLDAESFEKVEQRLADARAELAAVLGALEAVATPVTSFMPNPTQLAGVAGALQVRFAPRSQLRLHSAAFARLQAELARALEAAVGQPTTTRPERDLLRVLSGVAASEGLTTLLARVEELGDFEEWCEAHLLRCTGVGEEQRWSGRNHDLTRATERLLNRLDLATA